MLAIGSLRVPPSAKSGTFNLERRHKYREAFVPLVQGHHKLPGDEYRDWKTTCAEWFAILISIVGRNTAVVENAVISRH